MRFITGSIITMLSFAASCGAALAGSPIEDEGSQYSVSVDVDVLVAKKAPVPGSRLKTEVITDPGVNPPEPNGAGQRNQTQNTYANCASVMINGAVTSANITWTWRYSPTSDTNNDGKVNSSDQCPCAWVNTGYQVENLVNNEPLVC